MKEWRTEAGADLTARIERGDFDLALRPASTADVLGEGSRQFFGLAAEAARRQFDPATDWEHFVQALWDQVDAGFGITEDLEQ